MPFGVRGSGGGGFPTYSYFVSELIHYDVNNVLSAIPTVNVITDNGYGIFLSNDGGVSWENASNGVEHVFSSVGQKLMIRIVGNTGTVIGSELQSDNKIYLPGLRVDYTVG